MQMSTIEEREFNRKMARDHIPFTVFIWSIFKPYKLKKFDECINNGMSWHFAFIAAEKYKKL
jgi:hypothetical protein